MYTLTVYRNLDETQPQKFSGQNINVVLNKLERWIRRNDGSWTFENEQPCQIDGLMLLPDADDPHNVWIVDTTEELDFDISYGYDLAYCADFNEVVRTFVNKALQIGNWTE